MHHANNLSGNRMSQSTYNRSGSTAQYIGKGRLRMAYLLFLLVGAFAFAQEFTFDTHTLPMPYSNGGTIKSLAVGDYDGDGDLDVILGYNDTSRQNYLFRNDLNDSSPEDMANLFADATMFNSGPNDGTEFALTATQVARFIDLNNDGKLSMFFASSYGGNALRSETYVYDYTGTETSDKSIVAFADNGVSGSGGLREIRYVESVAFSDLNGDGEQDVALGRPTQSLYMTRDGSGYSATTNFAQTSHSNFGSVWGDYDNDGDQDLFVTSFDNLDNRLYRNDAGSLVAVDVAILNVGHSGAGSAWGDIDNDGDLDLMVSGSLDETGSDGHNALFRNNGGTFSEINGNFCGDIYSNHSQIVDSVWADINQDGLIDYVALRHFGALGSYSTKISFYKNLDGTNFSNPRNIDPGPGQLFEAIAVEDIDGDGDLDVVAGGKSVYNYYINKLEADPDPTIADNAYLKINWINTAGNYGATPYGTRITATIKDVDDVVLATVIRELGQDGERGQNSYTPHFGLGDGVKADLQIVYPDGVIATFDDVPAGTVNIAQGVVPGTPVAMPGSGVDSEGRLQLNGSLSYDATGQTLATYSWAIYDGSNTFVETLTGKTPYIDHLPVGQYSTNLTVTSIGGNTDTLTGLFGVPKGVGKPVEGLLAHWGFEDVAAGTLSDSEGNYSLTVMGSNPQSMTGELNNAFDTGANSYAQSSALMNFERTDRFSVSTWVNPDSVQGHSEIVGNLTPDSTYRGWSVVKTSAGKVGFWLFNNRDNLSANADGILVETDITLTAGAWSHIAVTYDGSSNASGVKIYINGSEETTTAVLDALGSTTISGQNLHVGSRVSTQYPYRFEGGIDEMRIYNGVLDASEVSALHTTP